VGRPHTFSSIMKTTESEHTTKESTEEHYTRKFIELAEAAGLSITLEHQLAFTSIFIEKRNVFITGGAGVGKTTFVKSIVLPMMNHLGWQFGVTATTGIAGSHLEGLTLNSWMGFGLGTDYELRKRGRAAADLDAAELEEVYEHSFSEWSNNPKMAQMRRGVVSRLCNANALLIDEVSMCAGKAMLGYVDFFLRRVRGDDHKPFGGLQMIMMGDFAQLPPVDKLNGRYTDWAFTSPSWRHADIKMCNLSEVFRQEDKAFAGFLNRRRVGIPMTIEEEAYVQSFVRQQTEAEVAKASFLVSTNAEADDLNDKALEWYPGPTYEFPALYHVPQDKIKTWETETKVREGLLKSGSLIKATLRLRIGTPVLLTVNNPDAGYVNGTKAFVHEIIRGSAQPGSFLNDDTIVVSIPHKNPDGEPKLINVQRRIHSRSKYEDPTITGWDNLPTYPALRQFPLMPATAITVHKCVDKSTLIPTNTGMQEIDMICNSSDLVKVAGVTAYNDACEPFVGVRELGYRITTRRGYSLLCSERHPLLRLTDDGEQWVKAPELREGDVLRMRGNTRSFGDGALEVYDRPADHHNANDYHVPTVMSDDLAWMLGVLTGDGCGTDKRDGRFDVTSMDFEITGEYTRVVNQLFGVSVTTTPKAADKEARCSYTHNWGVRRFLLHLGFTHDKAPLKRIPSCIWRGRQSHHAAFLRGYFDADGGVNNCVHVTSASRELLGDVHLMLLNMGIVSTLAQMTDSAWRINITGVDVVKYHQLVGFTIQRKIAACAALPSHSSVIPKAQCGEFPRGYGKQIAASLRDELRSVYPALKSFALGFGEHQAWAAFLSRVVSPSAEVLFTDAHLARMLQNLPKCIEAGSVSAKVFGEAAAGCFNDTITSIERVEGDMRDIAVPEGHAFIGNGFVNHNSQGMSLDECSVDLSRSFAPGHVYVALSRLRTAEGLTLLNSNFQVKVDPDVVDFYRTLT